MAQRRHKGKQLQLWCSKQKSDRLWQPYAPSRTEQLGKSAWAPSMQAWQAAAAVVQQLQLCYTGLS